MYNKLFTKILDSSIWLAPDPHRLVWITIIAAMDQDGNAMFACPENLALRARVSLKHCEAALKAFEGPDPKSGDPENDGMRIERIPGGWHVLNAHKYRAIVTKTISREQTRIRTSAWRQRRRDASVTQRDENVTPSDSVSDAVSDSNKTKSKRINFVAPSLDQVQAFMIEKGKPAEAMKFFSYYESNGWRVGRNPMKNWKAAVSQWLTRDFVGAGRSQPLGKFERAMAALGVEGDDRADF